MILNELVLHNVGTYAGRHRLELTPPSPNRPIVLVGGLNGAGKTTILEAIQLALYGPLSQASSRRSGSYEAHLRSLIHRGVPTSEGAAIELTFTVTQAGEDHVYWLRRSWKSTGASIREIMRVSVDGRHNQSLATSWHEHVETFLPRGIAGLFFFDGEQIEALADLERSRDVLDSALAALLGLDLVERLSTDLTALKRRHRGRQAPDHLREAIEEKRKVVEALRRSEDTALQVEAARKVEVDRAELAARAAAIAYSTAGGDLHEQRDAAETNSASLRSSIARVEDRLRHELAEHAPLLQVVDLLAQLASQLRIEEQRGQDELLREVLVSRDEALIRQLRSLESASSVVSAVESLLATDRAEREPAEIEIVVGVGRSADAEALRSGTLPETRRRIEAAIDELARLRRELEDSERAVAAIPEPEQVAPLLATREESKDSLLRAQAAHAIAIDMLDSARARRAKASIAFESALDRSAEATLAADDDRRLVEHLERVRATLDRLRVAAAGRHLERISALVLDALAQLLRKERLISDIEISPETNAVTLYGHDGAEIAASALSAGERQLLAVALLWWLARAAGQPLPIVVDTPLGRLDGTHREHLLERYFPQASHQVVLLTTDTEIDEESFARIAPSVGRTYRLEFDQATNATVVENGYFWETD